MAFDGCLGFMRQQIHSVVCRCFLHDTAAIRLQQIQAAYIRLQSEAGRGAWGVVRFTLHNNPLCQAADFYSIQVEVIIETI